LLIAPGAYPRRKHLKGPVIGFVLALPSNSKTRLERVIKGKPSSLLGHVISDEGKKFYNIDTWRDAVEAVENVIGVCQDFSSVFSLDFRVVFVPDFPGAA
jgi:hypothetical protein